MTKPTVLLLPGLGGDSQELWRDVVPHLRDAGYQSAPLELARNDKGEVIEKPEEIVSRIIDRIRSTPGDVILGGTSMGSQVTLHVMHEIATKNPDLIPKVHGLLLSDVPVDLLNQDDPHIHPQSTFEMMTTSFNRATSQEKEDIRAGRGFVVANTNDDVMERMDHTGIKSLPEIKAHFGLAHVGMKSPEDCLRVIKELGAGRPKIWVLGGKEDVLTPPQNVTDLMSRVGIMPDSMEFLDGVKHIGVVENPKAYGGALVRALGR